MTTLPTKSADASIGIFDSGFGGLTIMRAIKQALPHENILYFGDTARLPYGNKSKETILRYSQEITTFLIDQGVKILVIACNTACTLALTDLEKANNFPLFGVIAPGVDEVLRTTQKGKIGILGTRATVASGVYQNAIQCQLPQAEITALPCPLFVPLVEEGYSQNALAEAAIRDCLAPLHEKKLDTLLLACTHYPLLQPLIQKVMGAEVKLVDPAQNCARQVENFLKLHQLQNQQQGRPRYQFYVSDDPERFRQLGKTFLNYPIDEVSLASTQLATYP